MLFCGIYNFEIMKIISRLVFILIAICGLLQCTIEKQTAKSFIENRKNISVLILTPDFIFKENKNTHLIKNYAQLSDEEKETQLFAKSKYLRFVEDSTFIKNYSNGLINELKNYNISVYDESKIDSFLLLDTLAFVFKIGQMELDEYIYNNRESEYFDSEKYYQDFKLNAVSLYVWMDFSVQNDNKNSPITLFASNFVSDKIDGKFKKRFLYDDVVYVYTRKNMLMSRVNKLSNLAGKKHASYIFDYLMNYGVKTKNPVYNNLELMHFDRKRNKLQYVPEGNFIIMDN